MKTIHQTLAARKGRPARLLLCWCMAIALAMWAGVSFCADAGGTTAVQVQESPVRGKPSFLGPVLYTVAYGQPVRVLEQKGAWVRVEAAGKGAGWTHASALAAARTGLRAGERGVATGASGNELALAGKGFNAQVEAGYRSQHGDADYARVTAMEQTRYSEEAMRRFLRDGLLFPPPEGATP
ncbi:MAG: SH3 domain-containing protein [Desulfovibrionaceae bacterium]